MRTGAGPRLIEMGVSVFQALKRYADFTGRSDRPEYWLFFLFVILVAFGFGILNVVLSGASGQPNGLVMGLYGIFILAIIIPSLAVGFRRLHDTNRSAWWILISFLPLVGSIILIVFYCLPGTPGPNRFGPAPGSATGDLEATFT